VKGTVEIIGEDVDEDDEDLAHAREIGSEKK
jgi:hypothetical protein